MSETKNSKVVVVGSLSLLQVCRVENLPSRGETVAADDYRVSFGGRGANQAVSAARQGCDVSMIGAVGNDDFGKKYVKHLESEEGIDVSGVALADRPTGSIISFLESDTNSYSTVIAGGANEELSRTDISDLKKLIDSADVLLAQFEIPQGCVVEAVNYAVRAGVPVVLNPSPAVPNFPWDDYPVGHVIVNQEEAAELLDVHPEMADVDYIRQEIHDRRIDNLIVTRGSETTLVYTKEGDFYEVEPLPVLPIDPSGAGDAFAGCFAAWIADGKTVEDATRAANCAGALATLGGGAQRPIPDREKVEQHIEQIPKRRKVTRTA